MQQSEKNSVFPMVRLVESEEWDYVEWEDDVQKLLGRYCTGWLPG